MWRVAVEFGKSVVHEFVPPANSIWQRFNARHFLWIPTDHRCNGASPLCRSKERDTRRPKRNALYTRLRPAISCCYITDKSHLIGCPTLSTFRGFCRWRGIRFVFVGQGACSRRVHWFTSDLTRTLSTSIRVPLNSYLWWLGSMIVLPEIVRNLQSYRSFKKS